MQGLLSCQASLAAEGEEIKDLQSHTEAFKHRTPSLLHCLFYGVTAPSHSFIYATWFSQGQMEQRMEGILGRATINSVYLSG